MATRATREHLGAGDEPGALRGKDDGEDEVLVALERVPALGACVALSCACQVPELERLVERTRGK